MPRRTHPDSALEDHGYDGPSKTQVKKEMLELTALGPALLELPLDQYAALDLDERLREALDELRRLKVHGARKRQMQFVGKLMRNVDPEPLRKVLADFHASRMLNTRAMHAMEQWRERILAGDEGLNAWLAEHPDSDTREFRGWVRDAKRELAAGKKARAYRELFRALRMTLHGN